MRDYDTYSVLFHDRYDQVIMYNHSMTFQSYDESVWMCNVVFTTLTKLKIVALTLAVERWDSGTIFTIFRMNESKHATYIYIYICIYANI